MTEIFRTDVKTHNAKSTIAPNLLLCFQFRGVYVIFPVFYHRPNMKHQRYYPVWSIHLPICRLVIVAIAVCKYTNTVRGWKSNLLPNTIFKYGNWKNLNNHSGKGKHCGLLSLHTWASFLNLMVIHFFKIKLLYILILKWKANFSGQRIGSSVSILLLLHVSVSEIKVCNLFLSYSSSRSKTISTPKFMIYGTKKLHL